MNRANIQAVINVLENLDDSEFVDMTKFFRNNRKTPEHPCGTPSCIAGYTLDTLLKAGDPLLEDFLKKKADTRVSDSYTIELASHLLGITGRYGVALFNPDLEVWGEVNPSEITPGEAAKVLRHLLETGKVDWGVAFN